MKIQKRALFFLLTCLFFLPGCEDAREIETFTGSTMGTYYSVKISGVEGKDKARLKSSMENKLKAINQVFSTYIEDSEISQINRAPSDKEIKISKEMEKLFRISKELHEQTSGYFDITVGPIVNAWGFGPDGKRNRPEEAKLEELKKHSGMEKVTLLKAKTLLKKSKEVYLDMSAIAKGYGVDALADLIRQKGYKSALVEIGGEVRAVGVKPNGEPWLIGIEKPSESLGGGGIQEVAKLKDVSMATSGSYRNYVKYGEEVFSHVIDPLTGRPSLTDVISVTVLAEKCAIADAYATALMAMGSEKALELTTKRGIPAYFIVKKGNGTAILMTESFKPFIRK